MADNYDDDFEAYEDDFDDDVIESPVPTKTAEAVVYSSASKNATVIATSKISNNDSKSITSSSKSLKPNNLKAKESSVEYRSPQTIESDNMLQAQIKSKPAYEQAYNGKFSSSISLADTLSINPYLRRLKNLFNSKVLDLQEEKFSQLNILPTTLADLYYHQLKGRSSTTSTSTSSGNSTMEMSNTSATGTATATSSTATIRQVGTNTREETRDVEMNTDEVILYDKEMQFSYGSDDTMLLNIIKDIQNKDKTNNNRSNRHDKSNNNVNSINNSVTFNQKNINNDDVSNYSSLSKLSTFLHKSYMLCEIILDDGRIKAEENNKWKQSKTVDNSLDTLDQSILDHTSTWIKFGENERNGSTELIAFRNVVAIKFSILQPNLVLTAHPYPTNESDITHELKPFKGLYCIWDTSNPSVPVYVLESTGQPTSCCFSSTQSFIVVAGTEEGTVLMWNLLESSSIHKDRDSKDLGISRGIRKPCYTTVLSNDSRLQKNDTDGTHSTFENEYHVAAITQMESLGHQTISITPQSGEPQQQQQQQSSQFVSIDITGQIIFWITKTVNNNSNNNDSNDFDNSSSSSRKEGSNRSSIDFGLSPWSNLKLISVRSLRVSEFTNDLSSLSNYSMNSIGGADIGSGNSGGMKIKSSGASGGGVGSKFNDSNNNNLTPASFSSSSSSSSSSILSSPCIIGIVANDVSTVYASTSYGRVSKCNRYQSHTKNSNNNNNNIQNFQNNILKPRNYDTITLNNSSNTTTTTTSSDIMNLLNVFGDQYIYSNVTSISIQMNLSSLHSEYINNVKQSNHVNGKEDDPKQSDEMKSSFNDNDNSSHDNRNNSNNQSSTILGRSSFVLIGRADGGIDLYAVNDDNNYLLHSWTTTSSGDFGNNNNNNSNSNQSSSSSMSIIFLKWCPQKSSSFFAINSIGILYYFDILIDPYIPLFTEQLPYPYDKESDKNGKNVYDLCLSKYSNNVLYLVIKLKNKYNIYTIQVHKLSNTNIKLCKNMIALLDEDVALRSSLSQWACRMNIVDSSIINASSITSTSSNTSSSANANARK